MLIDALPDGARILSVQESPPGEVIRSVWSPRMPSLYLQETEDWKSIVQPIIYRAELIVSEFTFLSEGVRWELETCRAFGKHHQTVLIVPPPRTAFAPLDHLRPLDQFPRVLWADHLFTERLSEAFVLKDFLERVATIARLPAQERLKLFAEDGLKARVPISYEGVLAGYPRGPTTGKRARRCKTTARSTTIASGIGSGSARYSACSFGNARPCRWTKPAST